MLILSRFSFFFLQPLHTFSPEKQGAILSVWAKLPQPNCLQYLKNSILTTEATAYFDIVIPKSSVPLSKITDDTTYRIPQSIAEVTSLVDVYRILGVSNKATFKEIDEAYDVSSFVIPIKYHWMLTEFFEIGRFCTTKITSRSYRLP